MFLIVLLVVYYEVWPDYDKKKETKYIWIDQDEMQLVYLASYMHYPRH